MDLKPLIGESVRVNYQGNTRLGFNGQYKVIGVTDDTLILDASTTIPLLDIYDFWAGPNAWIDACERTTPEQNLSWAKANDGKLVRIFMGYESDAVGILSCDLESGLRVVGEPAHQWTAAFRFDAIHSVGGITAILKR